VHIGRSFSCLPARRTTLEHFLLVHARTLDARLESDCGTSLDVNGSGSELPGGVAASRQPSSTATPTASSGSGVAAGASSAGSGWTGTGGARLRLVAVQLAGSILRFSLFFLFCGGFVRSLHVVDSGDVETAHLSIFFCGPATEYDRMIGDICSDIHAVHKHVLADYAETPSCTAI